MMLTKSKLSLGAFAFVSLTALYGCASQAPKVNNTALGYAVTNYAIAADGSEEALSGALGASLLSVGIATAMPAKAEVSIDLVRYDSPIIGLFYGGRHHANLSVTLTDNTGSKISSFPIYVAANGTRSDADADLAKTAAQIIAAKAAAAYMPIKARPKAMLKPVVAPAIVEIAEPAVEPAPIDTTPCVIGPDGNCVVL